MIEDLSKSINALLAYELLTPGQEIIPNLSISFAQPDQNFPPASVTKPAVNVFLYDIREDLKLRHNEWLNYQSIAPAGYEVRRQPLLIECSYLITAWSDSVTATANDEHTVLSAIINPCAVIAACLIPCPINLIRTRRLSVSCRVTWQELAPYPGRLPYRTVIYRAWGNSGAAWDMGPSRALTIPSPSRWTCMIQSQANGSIK